jgi:hypothetical protein
VLHILYTAWVLPNVKIESGYIYDSKSWLKNFKCSFNILSCDFLIYVGHRVFCCLLWHWDAFHNLNFFSFVIKHVNIYKKNPMHKESCHSINHSNPTRVSLRGEMTFLTFSQGYLQRPNRLQKLVIILKSTMLATHF